MRLEFGIEGLDMLMLALGKEPERMARGVAKGLYRSALEIMAVSQEIVPIGGPPTSPYDPAPGTLKASGHVNEPEIDGGTVYVEFGYGGAASDYAVVQHERLDYQHKPGQSAKFLENPALNDIPNIPGRIADAIAEEG